MDAQRGGIDLEALATAEADIEAHLDRLASLEAITEDDLEALRRSLPTDPMLARAVQLTLPYPWSELFEFVEGSERQTAYWRISPERRVGRSVADREHKRRFARAARDARGTEGTVKRDGRTIPASAAHVADTVSGEGTERDDGSDAGERALKRLQELLGV